MRIAAIMRHAEPVEAGDGRPMALDRDRRLTEQGRRQAEAARVWLAGLEPARVLCSDSPRAIETAEIVGAPLQPQIVPDLAGMRLGAWEQDPLDLVRTRVRALLAGRLDAPAGAETVEELARRARDAFRRALPSAGNVLVVAHRLTNAVLLTEYLGLPPERALRVPQDLGAVSLLSLDDSRDQVLALNVTPLDPLRLAYAEVEDL